jgi:hypothetical protein
MKLLPLMTALGIVGASIHSPVVKAHNHEQEQKEIQVRNVVSQDLNVTVKPTRNTYAVNESIRFNVTGNKDFFLYLFSVNENTKKATMIFPNAQHKGNKFKAGHKNRIPNKKIEFYSNKPGKEKLVAIASTNYFDWDTRGYKAFGDFKQIDTTTFETQTKAFRIRSRAQASQQNANNSRGNIQTEQIHVQEVFATVNGKPSTRLAQQVVSAANQVSSSSNTPPMSNSNSAIVFSGTDKKVYKSGEIVNILVGANMPGMLHIFTAEPNGRLVPLTTKAINGKGFETIQAEATAPYGVHALVVAYSKDKKLHSDYLVKQYKKEALAGQSKGLRLIQKPEPISYSVSEFKIVK